MFRFLVKKIIFWPTVHHYRQLQPQCKESINYRNIYTSLNAIKATGTNKMQFLLNFSHLRNFNKTNITPLFNIMKRNNTTNNNKTKPSSSKDKAPNPKRKPKSEAASESTDSSTTSDSDNDAHNTSTSLQQATYTNLQEFMSHLQQERAATASNVLNYAFKKKRVRVLSKASEVNEKRSGGIVYWMSRDARVQDNWAFLFAQKLALKLELPLLVVFCLVPKFLNATLRHYKFLLGGLEEVERDCCTLNIPFRLLLGPAVEHLPEFVRAHNIGAVVCDFAPLRVPRKWVDDVAQALPENVPLTQVDAHNVVPLWIASDKQEYAARTIRNKINSKLAEYLTQFPPLVKHPHSFKLNDFKPIDWQAAHDMLECDMSVDEVNWAKPGYTAACKQLYEFCTKRLRIFDAKRNDPTVDALSGLSPWFHFGQISVQRCILEVKRFQSKHKQSVEAFCEEAIVRRELADNFCYFNENYDNLKGVHDWAFKTLDEHRKDKRTPVYTLTEFEQARTHDDLWNSAQLQLVREGKMHGFLRMYWAKKILEWAATPEEALEYAILLNDKYSLDGRDPNGYVGCMWSIGGVHDQGWKERPIFGKVRYMNYQGCKRKFDVTAYVMRYGGKVHKK